MEDVAQKITKRLYGDDKVKYEIILTMLYVTQKIGEDIRYFTEGILDEFIRGQIELLEETNGLEKFQRVREQNITISDWEKHIEFFEDVDVEKLDKNSWKELTKRFWKHMNSQSYYFTNIFMLLFLL